MRFFYILYISSLLGCYNRNIPKKKTVIIGNVKNFTRDSVFIAQANEWDKPLHWAKVTNGRFQFTIENIPDNAEPFLASIGYKADLKKIKLFEYQNAILSPDSIKYLYGSFYVDTSSISVYGDLNISPYLKIIAGQETKALYRTQMMSFGNLDIDVVKRSKELTEYTGIISNYPTSRYLLSSINENKSLMKKDELQLLLSKFSTECLKTDLGKQLIKYSSEKLDIPTFKNIELVDNQGVLSKVFDTTARINMIIVWASWCGPCIKEIPEITQLISLNKTPSFTVTSISIDEEKDNWLKALNLNKMSWRQLFVQSDRLKEFNTEYEVGSIPYVLFINDKGKLIKRFIGYNKSNFEEYKKILTQ